MQLPKTIIITSVALWLVQLGLFALLFATWFSSIVVRILVCIGLHVPESSLQNFISKILNDLMLPIRLFAPAHQVGDGSVSVALTLGADSLIWGLIIGTLIHFIGRLFHKPKAA